MPLDPADVDALQRTRILLVEGEAAVARQAGSVLQARQAEVSVVTSAAEAIQLVLGGLHPAIVLVGLDLPDLPGLDLVKVLRALHDTRDLPILALVAPGVGLAPQAAALAGCDGVIRQPLDIDTLPGTVAAYLRPTWSRRGTPGPAPAASIGSADRAILDALPTAIAVTRPADLTILYGNRKFEELTGYRMPDLIGMSMAMTNPGGEAAVAEMREVIRRDLDRHGEASFEQQRLRADRSAVWIQVTVSRLEHPELGEVWLLVFDDVSRRRKTDDDLKKALARSESRFASLWAAGILGIAVTDPAGRLLDANDRFLEIIGRTRDDVVHGRVTRADYSPPEYLTQDGAAMATIRRGGFVAPREKEYVRADGTRIPVLVGGTLLDAGTVVGYAIDLTASASPSCSASCSRAAARSGSTASPAGARPSSSTSRASTTRPCSQRRRPAPGRCAAPRPCSWSRTRTRSARSPARSCAGTATTCSRPRTRARPCCSASSTPAPSTSCSPTW